MLRPINAKTILIWKLWAFNFWDVALQCGIFFLRMLIVENIDCLSFDDVLILKHKWVVIGRRVSVIWFLFVSLLKSIFSTRHLQLIAFLQLNSKTEKVPSLLLIEVLWQIHDMSKYQVLTLPFSRQQLWVYNHKHFFCRIRNFRVWKTMVWQPLRFHLCNIPTIHP